MFHQRIRRWSRSWRFEVAGLAFLLVLFHPGAASALVTENYLRGEFTANGPLAGIYDYQQASVASWSTSAEFDAGTHNGTSAQGATDTLTLGRIGPTGVVEPDPATPWFDTQWNTRQCYRVDHTGGATSVTEYPVRVAFNSGSLIAAGLLQADLGDLRAVAADGATLLPVWIEDAATAWIQVDGVAAGATTQVCLYYGYEPGAATAPATNSDAAVFTYSTPKAVYYTVSARYTGTETVNVASYVDGNTVERDNGTTASLVLNDGELGSLGGNTPGTVYRVMGPIASRGVGDGFDTLVPISWAGTRFIVPSNRPPAPAAQQRLSFYAPFVAASIAIYAGSDATPLATVNVPAGTAASWLETPDDAIGPGESVVIESSVPVLAHHATDDGADSMALHPVTSEDWFGVSTVGQIGFDGDLAGGSATTARVSRSATSTPVALSQFRGDEVAITGSPGGGGPDDGIMLRLGGGPAQAAVTAISQGDGSGADSVTFVPRDELGSRYLLVTDSAYVAASCPSPALSVAVTTGAGATSSFTCTGTSEVGHGVDAAGRATGAGRAVEVASAGAPFYAMYDDAATRDETNVLGMKQGRQYVWPAPTALANSPEGRYVDAGSWESATFDIGSGSEVFGEIRITGTADPATTVEIRVATSDTDPPTAFVGPDGTAATHWTAASVGSVLDHGHDGDTLLRIRVDMTTTDPFATAPQVESIEVDHHLSLVNRSPGGRGVVTVSGSLTGASTYLFRVRTTEPALAASSAQIDAVTVTNGAILDNAALRMENLSQSLDVTQWSTTGASATPVAFDDGRPHSVVLDHTSTGQGTITIEFTWDLDVGGGSSLFVQSDLTVEIENP